MVFSSLAFLCAFLPAVFLLALAIPSTRAQNVLLLAASLLFYAYGEPVYTVLMVAVSLAAYAFGLLVGRARGPRARKALCVAAVAACLGCLGVFKYAGWVADTVSGMLGGGAVLPEPNIVLPVGISFYTFQALSYIVDVYRGDVRPERNLVRVLLYISFFPQLIAGPIIRYHDIDEQLADRRITLEGVSAGMKRFIVGLAKKVLVADVMAAAVDPVFAADPGVVNAPLAWIAALAYLVQIYFDFSGYSDMAIGMARMFGFTYKENFDYPYVSTSVKEFWRRWHISLSTWLKEYLYIPLGGNRRGRARTVANKVFVFFCCGLWHGAAWTFVVWGLIHGFFLLLEEYLPIRKLPRPVGWAYCMAVVMLAFVVFRADSFGQAAEFLGAMFAGWGAGNAQSDVLLAATCTPLFLFTLAAGVAAAFPVLPAVRDRAMRAAPAVQRRVDVLAAAACAALLVACLLTLASGVYSPFIYFRF